MLDQAVRVMNAMLDIAAGFGLLETTLGLLRLHQMVVQVCLRSLFVGDINSGCKFDFDVVSNMNTFWHTS